MPIAYETTVAAITFHQPRKGVRPDRLDCQYGSSTLFREIRQLEAPVERPTYFLTLRIFTILSLDQEGSRHFCALEVSLSPQDSRSEGEFYERA